MSSPVSQVFREPVPVFALVFLLSLGACWVLFQILDSRASIKGKGWSAGGAIAGFLVILFGSFYALRPFLQTIPRTMPVSTPAGYKPISVSDMGIALAVPKDWEKREVPTQILVTPSQQQPNSSDPKFLWIQLRSCSEPPSTLSEHDLSEARGPLQQMFGMVHFRGPSVSDSYLGYQASTTPVSLTFPGQVLVPPQTAELSINILLRDIYDEPNGRCILLYYPDSDMGRMLASTLNITNPPY